MHRGLFTCLLLIFLGFVHVQGQSVLLQYFTIDADGANVMMKWEMQSEKGLKEFRIFRRFDNERSLAHVATIPLNGTNKYTFLDDNIFKTQGRVIHYELHVVSLNKTHKFYGSLSHNPTSIQRTWGSIKSMFR
ncbi:MAG: hypothetical protein AAFR61_16860 [Bacteroidota bacterium]